MSRGFFLRVIQTCHSEKTLENIVGKGENPFPTMFLLFERPILRHLMSSASALNLVKLKYSRVVQG